MPGNDSSFASLLDLVDHHLLNALVENERPETILDTVLQEYSHDLRRRGQIPTAFVDDVIDELRETAREIIRKRTYGCLTIAEFRASRKR